MKGDRVFKNMILSIIGVIIYSLGVNYFIVPMNLYSGGFVGISQLVLKVLNYFFYVNMNLQGVLYLVFNIPVFIIGYKILGRRIISSSVLIVILESLFLSAIPIPETALVNDTLTATIIGGVLQGIGCVFTFIGFSSGGGTDILGLIFAKKTKKITVGMTSLVVNLVLYTVCAFSQSFEVAVYSLIASLFCSFVIDKYHLQNNCVSVNILSGKYNDIKSFIIDELKRDVTILDGTGGYSNKDKKLLISIMSEYELNELEKRVRVIDENAFIFIHPNVTILGNFEKRVS